MEESREGVSHVNCNSLKCAYHEEKKKNCGGCEIKT